MKRDIIKEDRVFIVATLILLVILSILSVGLPLLLNSHVSTTAETVTIYETEYIDRPIQTTVYVPEPYPVEVPVPYEIEVPIYVDRIVETPIEYKDWESVNQFIEWYREQDFTILMPSSAYKVDCDDYAARLQREALKDGYAVSQIIFVGTDYYTRTVREQTGGHAACMIMVEDKYYYVEPHPKHFKVIYLAQRD